MSEPMMTVTEATFVVKVARRYLRPQGVSTQDWEQQKAALKETVPMLNR